MFELILKVPVGSGIRIRFKNSDKLDPEPAENGPDPQHWVQVRYGTVPVPTRTVGTYRTFLTSFTSPELAYLAILSSYA